MSGYGLTFSAWRGRLSGSLDVCNRRSSGVVWRDGLGDRFGEYTNQIVNKFTIQNKGWDGWLQWQVLHRKKLDWNLTLTVNRNRSKVLAILPEAGGLFRYALDRTYPGIRIYDIMDNLIEIGQPIGVWYGQVLAAKFSKRLTNSPSVLIIISSPITSKMRPLPVWKT